MHKPDAPCRVTGVALASMDIQMGQNGLTLTVVSHLVDDQGTSHGRKTYVGPWSEETVQLLHDITMRVEEELARIHFEVGRNDRPTDIDTADSEERPKGLLAARLGSSEDQTPQI